jgi:hypothetical protein
MRPAQPSGERAAVIFSDVSASDAATLDPSFFSTTHIEDLISQFCLAVADPLEFLSRNELLNRPVVYLLGSLEEQFFFDTAEDSDYLFCLRQRLKFLEYFEFLLGEYCQVIDQPALIRSWSNKLIQLQRLRALGLSVPRIPLDPCAASEFPLVMKPISESGALSASEVFYVQEFNAEAFTKTDGTPSVPLVAQERLLFRHEFRVSVLIKPLFGPTSGLL